MANLKITAPAAAFEQGVTSLVGFHDASGAPIRPMGVECDGVIAWTVPDTDKNRDVFREAYKPSGNFKAEVVDARDDTLAPVSLVEENKSLKARLAEREAEMLSLNQQLAQVLAENEELKASLAELANKEPAVQPTTSDTPATTGKGKK